MDQKLKLQNSQGKKQLCLGFRNGFLSMTPKAQATKGKKDKLDFIKIQYFCVSKDAMKKKDNKMGENI